LNFSNWIGMQNTGIDLILAPQAERSLAQIQPAPEKIRLAIGPEGGFSDDEIKNAITAHFTALSLGPRILRTETAVVASLSAVQTLWGDLNTMD